MMRQKVELINYGFDFKAIEAQNVVSKNIASAIEYFVIFIIKIIFA